MRGGVWAGLVTVVLCAMVAGPALGALTERVSVGNEGEEGNECTSACWTSMSEDGRLVAFASWSTNLVPDDTNGEMDVFVRDLQNQTTELVSAGENGQSALAGSWRPSLSADGRYVVFNSINGDLMASAGQWTGCQVYLRDLLLGKTELVSVGRFGIPPNGDSYDAAVSRDGRYVVFLSEATNLLSVATEGRAEQVYLRDRKARTTTLLSADASGHEGDGRSWAPTIASNGAACQLFLLRWESVAGGQERYCGRVSMEPRDPSAVVGDSGE